MTDRGFDPLASIAAHSRGLAEEAVDRLSLAVPSCPGWTLADLVAHVTDVQWFWATIVEDRLSQPPQEERRIQRAPDDHLIDAFGDQTAHLLDAVRSADPGTKVWTWAPAQQDVGFILRHQVQEAAVHHWDAANATGKRIELGTAESADSVEEFLTFSVSSDRDLADPPRPSLGGSFGLRCTDADLAWTLTDGRAQGAVRWERGVRSGVPAIEGTASDLLLWLYRRISLDTRPVPAQLLSRFTALTFTD